MLINASSNEPIEMDITSTATMLYLQIRWSDLSSPLRCNDDDPVIVVINANSTECYDKST